MSDKDKKGDDRRPKSAVDAFITQALHWDYVWLKAIARAWNEEGFQERFKRDPSGVLAREFGYSLPEGVTLKVEPGGAWGDSLGTWYLPFTEVVMKLPPRPAEDEALAFAEYAEMTAFYMPAAILGQ